VTIAVVTHGDGGSFWSVGKKGAEDAGKDLGITVKHRDRRP
jgi:simple sugar transport system substrate-binding protein